MSLCTIAPRPLRRLRTPQLLAWLRTFDDALTDIDDDSPTIVAARPGRTHDSGIAA